MQLYWAQKCKDIPYSFWIEEHILIQLLIKSVYLKLIKLCIYSCIVRQINIVRVHVYQLQIYNVFLPN